MPQFIYSINKDSYNIDDEIISNTDKTYILLEPRTYIENDKLVVVMPFEININADKSKHDIDGVKIPEHDYDYDILQFDNIKLCQGAFDHFTGKITATDSPTLPSDMSRMFNLCTSSELNIGHWITTHVTNMNSMFYGATNFNTDISNWNTENVTNMEYMFYGAINFNQNINNWNIDKVMNIKYMSNGNDDINEIMSIVKNRIKKKKRIRYKRKKEKEEKRWWISKTTSNIWSTIKQWLYAPEPQTNFNRKYFPNGHRNDFFYDQILFLNYINENLCNCGHDHGCHDHGCHEGHDHGCHGGHDFGSHEGHDFGSHGGHDFGGHDHGGS